MHLPKRPAMVFQLKEVARALPSWNITSLRNCLNSWI